MRWCAFLFLCLCVIVAEARDGSLGTRISGAAPNDYRAAVQRQRPISKRSPRMDELQSFKGFHGEQSVYRRMNNRLPEGESLKWADRNDPIADFVHTDKAGIATRIQLYLGANPRQSLEKALGSDAEAGKFIVPKDVHARINAALRESDTLYSAFKEGKLDKETCKRQMRHRLKGLGLVVYDDLSIGLTVDGQQRTLSFDAGEVEVLREKFIPDTKTSAQISRDTLRGMLLANPNSSEGRFARAFNIGDDASVREVQRLFDQRVEYYKSKGMKHHVATKKAGNWLKYTKLPELRNKIEATMAWARAMEVSENVIAGVLEKPRGGDLDLRAGDIQSELTGEVRRTSLRRHAYGQGAALVFMLAGAGVDFYGSGQEVLDWIRSDQGAEWGVRAVMAAGITAFAIGVETEIAKRATLGTGKKGVQKGLGVMARITGTSIPFTGGAVAGVLFVAGESVIQVAVRGKSLVHVSGQVAESAIVMVASEAAGLGAAYLAGVAGFGSAAGPLGIGVAVGGAIAYEGVKYAVVFKRDLRIAREILYIRLDAAEEQARKYYSQLANSYDAAVP